MFARDYFLQRWEVAKEVVVCNMVTVILLFFYNSDLIMTLQFFMDGNARIGSQFREK